MSDTAQTPKRRWRWAAVIILALFIFTAVLVARRQSFASRAARLRPGMTKAEVIAAMGQPDHLMKLGDVEIALFTPIPFPLHALFTRPGQTLSGNSNIPATEFPAYVEFRKDIATRVLIEGQDIDATK